MKKLLFALVCAISMIGLSSCSKDDSEPKAESIVGTWELMNSGEKVTITHEFSKNGSWTQTWDWGFDGIEERGGHYSVQDDILIIIDEWDDAKMEENLPWKYYYTYSIKSNKLTLMPQWDDDVEVYVRRK